MGRPLASGSDDKTIKLWNLDAVRFALCLDIQNRFYPVAFDLDGQTLPVAVRTRQSSCGIWALETVAHPIWTFKASWVCLQPNRQGSCQWLGQHDQAVEFGHWETGSQPLWALRGFFRYLRMGRLLPVVARTTRSSCNPGIGKLLYTLSGHSKPVRLLPSAVTGKPSQVVVGIRQSKFGTYVQES